MKIELLGLREVEADKHTQALQKPKFVVCVAVMASPVNFVLKDCLVYASQTSPDNARIELPADVVVPDFHEKSALDALILGAMVRHLKQKATEAAHV